MRAALGRSTSSCTARPGRADRTAASPRRAASSAVSRTRSCPGPKRAYAGSCAILSRWKVRASSSAKHPAMRSPARAQEREGQLPAPGEDARRRRVERDELSPRTRSPFRLAPSSSKPRGEARRRRAARSKTAIRSSSTPPSWRSSRRMSPRKRRWMRCSIPSTSNHGARLISWTLAR